MKLLARRGSSCQLTKYAEAATTISDPVELDPDNERLRNLRLIEQQVGGQVM